MATIKAFYGIRPRKDLTEHIAALPYDVYSSKEARKEVERESFSFLKIDRAETQFEEGTDIYAPEVYQKAHDTLWNMVEEGMLIKEDRPCLYLYELTMNGRAQTGLVACASVDDYLNGVICKHENTREEKEQDRIRHVDVCNAQTGPIFLAYRRNETIRGYVEKAKQEPPVFDFTSPDGIRHRGWKIEENCMIENICQAFASVPRIYIADGHHRAASAVKVSLKRRLQAEKNGSVQELREYDYFLSVLFPEEELQIMDYNRVVTDLNGMKPEELLEKIETVCSIEKLKGEAIPGTPSEKGILRMYLDGSWYTLVIREEYRSADPVDGLDVSILQNRILEPFLGIRDPKTDQRIRFVGGIRGKEELKKMADAYQGVAFAMYPTSMTELFAVADAGKLMPPKSTWFEPKLRSGLFIHEL